MLDFVLLLFNISLNIDMNYQRILTSIYISQKAYALCLSFAPLLLFQCWSTFAPLNLHWI